MKEKKNGRESILKAWRNRHIDSDPLLPTANKMQIVNSLIKLFIFCLFYFPVRQRAHTNHSARALCPTHTNVTVIAKPMSFSIAWVLPTEIEICVRLRDTQSVRAPVIIMENAIDCYCLQHIEANSIGSLFRQMIYYWWQLFIAVANYYCYCCCCCCRIADGTSVDVIHMWRETERKRDRERTSITSVREWASVSEKQCEDCWWMKMSR